MWWQEHYSLKWHARRAAMLDGRVKPGHGEGEVNLPTEPFQFAGVPAPE